MSKIIGNPTVTPMAVPDWNQNDSTKADYIKNKPDIYTKAETKTLLDSKVNKDDITNVYRFRGSVESFEKLPTEYTFEVCDAPYIMQDGEKKAIGYYHSETGVVSFNYELPPQSSAVIIIPIETKTMNADYYAFGRMDFDAGFNIPDEDEVYVERYIGEEPANITSFYCSGNPFAYYDNEREISGLYLYCYNDSDESASIGGTGRIACSIQSVLYKGFMEQHEPLTSGDVYNTTDTGMNYAWTGTSWDALGGSVSDESVKEDIDKIETELNKKADKTTTESLQRQINNKANKEDIVSAYRFCGSVEKFDDLPYNIPAIADGFPVTELGEPLDSSYYDYDENSKTITIHEDAWSDYRIIAVPIKPINITAGCWLGGVDLYDESLDEYISIGYTFLYHYDEFSAKFLTNAAGGFGSGVNSYSIGQVLSWLEKPLETDIITDENGNMEGYTKVAIGDVYNITKDGMNYAYTGDGWDALGGEHKDVEARKEIERLKESAVSAYRFCGSVETFDDLPISYQLIPNGVPTYKGEPCGSFKEETHEVTINETMLEKIDEDRIIVPIVPINVKAGKYYIEYVSQYNKAYIGELCTWACANAGTPYEFMEDITIDHIEIFTTEGYKTISVTTDNLGTLPRIIDSWIDESGMVQIPDGAYICGAVYEVKKSGIDDDGNDIATSYGWTGSSWDALGTSHVDQAARDDIQDLGETVESLQLQIDDIESALDGKADKSDVYTKEEADIKFSNGGSNVIVDQTYNATSENPQSGKAVAEALSKLDVGGGGAVGNINEEQLKDAMYNLPIEVLEKTFIHKSTGAKTSPAPSFHSLVYRVFGLSKIRTVNTKLSGNAGWAFYDKDNNVITSGNALADIDVPSNAYTFAVSVCLSSMSAEDVAIYADFTNVLAYKSDLESCVRTDVSRIFNDDNANAKTKVMAEAIKELYIPDEAYKGILRLCAFRKITNTVASIQLFAYINGTLTSIYRCVAQTILYGTQLIKLERTSAYGEPAYILVDWDSVPDGASYTGNTSDIYLLNDTVFDKENSPTICGYSEENPHYNSDVVFDTCFAGEMSTQLLELKRNYNLPHKGMYISTDIDFYEKTSDIKGLVPYLYFNGEKIGTVVLYDDNGNPFIYLKDGTKKVLL